LGKNSETMARNAATAETRAAKDSNARSARETTMDLQRKVDVAQDEVAEALGVSKNEVNAKLKIMAKRAETDPNAKAELEKVQEVRNKLTEARNRLTAWEAKTPADKAEPAAEKAPPKPTTSQIQSYGGSSVGNFVAGRGHEIKDRAGKVLGYWSK
jgi:hypothetical protein